MSDSNGGRIMGAIRRKTTYGDVSVPPPAPQLCTLASDAVVQYCNAAAQKMEEVIAEVREKCEQFCEDGQKTADNLRQIGDMEKARTSAFYATVKGALNSVVAARKVFDDYMAQAQGVPEVEEEVKSIVSQFDRVTSEREQEAAET